MTVTETPPPETAEPEATAPAPVDPLDPERLVALEPPAGLPALLSNRDHRTIGLGYILLSLLLAMFAFVIGALVALESADVGGIDLVGSRHTFFQLFGLYRVALVFFVVMPLLIGIATYVVPAQLGTDSLAYPRAAAAAFWTWVAGVGIHITAVFVNGGLGSFTGDGDVEAVQLTLLSLGLVALALLMATISLVTTVIAFRPEGMKLNRVPLFSWSILVAGGVWLLSIVGLIANIVVIWVDLRGTGVVLYGQGDVIYEQLRWVFDQPEVFAFAIPVLGIVGDIVPVSFGVRQKAHPMMAALIGAFGLFAFGAWAQPFFNPQLGDQVMYVAYGVLIGVPLLGLLGGWATAARSGSPRLHAQLLVAGLAIAALGAAVAIAFLRVLGPAIGVIREGDPDVAQGFFDFMDRLSGSSAATGLLLHVVAAGLLGAVAGLHHWAPRILGRRLDPLLGVASALLLAGGGALAGVPQVVAAFLRQPDDVFLDQAFEPVTETSAVEAMNLISAIGTFVLLAGVGIVLVNLAVATLVRRGDDDPDPWEGHTLEWAADPAAYVPIRSEAPLLDGPAETDEEANR